MVFRLSYVIVVLPLKNLDAWPWETQVVLRKVLRVDCNGVSRCLKVPKVSNYTDICRSKPDPKDRKFHLQVPMSCRMATRGHSNFVFSYSPLHCSHPVAGPYPVEGVFPNGLQPFPPSPAGPRGVPRVPGIVPSSMSEAGGKKSPW